VGQFHLQFVEFGGGGLVHGALLTSKKMDLCGNVPKVVLEDRGRSVPNLRDGGCTAIIQILVREYITHSFVILLEGHQDGVSGTLWTLHHLEQGAKNLHAAGGDPSGKACPELFSAKGTPSG
jgi:hypothetical protein